MPFTKIRGNTQIKPGTITDAEVATNANIQLSKLQGGSTLLSPATVTNPQNNQLLAYDSATSSWINKTVSFSGVQDGDKGDIVVSGNGSSWVIDSGAVTYDKIQNVNTDKLLGRFSSGSGVLQEITCTAAGRAILDDIDAAAQRVTLGAGDVNGPTSSTDNAIARFDLTTGKLLQNSLVTISDSGDLDATSATVDYLQIDTTATPPTSAVGLLMWDATDGSAILGLEGGSASAVLGQHTVAKVRNAESTTLLKGEVVYLFGASGNRASVKRASNASDVTSNKTFGLVAEPIAANQTGFVITQGVISGLDLGAPYVDGDVLWLGNTPGTFTRTKPTQPQHLVFVGVVQRANSGAGQIYVKPQNGYELDEIHDVLITNPQSGNTIIYDQTAGLWKNANLTAGGSISITGGAGSISVAVADGNKTDIAVSNSGSTWVINNDAVTTLKIADANVTLAKMANVAGGSVFYRKTGTTGVPEVQSLATLKTDLGLSGTNSGDITVTDSSDIDFTLTGQNITGVINYTTGQSATSSTKGFLTSADWTTFNNKQNLLVSGTNIKTINGTSVLGSGDILPKIDARRNNDAAVTARKRLNFIEGTNITLTVADDSVNDEIDITINSSGGGSAITSLNTQTGTTQTFATSAGTTETDFTISSLTNTHTFIIPSASETARGLITTGTQTIAGVKTLNSAPILNSLTASLPLKLDASKIITSAAINIATGSTEITGTLPLTSGGTGATTDAAARTNLGATTVGANLFTLTNPSAVTFIRLNADNTVSTLSSTSFRIAIGATTVGSNLLTLTNPSAITFLRVNADNTVSALDAATFRTAIGAGTGNGTLSSLNSQTGATQTFATSSGTTETDFTISSATNTHTFIIPDASATARGLITTGAQTLAGAKTLTSQLTITQATNNASIFTTTGYSLTGANAQSLIDVSGTWNTTGTPTLIKANVTDTASNANSLLIDLQTGGTSRFKVAKSGNVEVAGTLKIGAYTLPSVDGANGQVLKTNGSGVVTWQNDETGAGGSGITSLNTLTTTTQTFATGTTGTDFNIVSNTSTHTFHIPDASGTKRGALTSADWTTFNNKQAALVSGTNIKTINGTSLLGSGDLSPKIEVTKNSGAIVGTRKQLNFIEGTNVTLTITDDSVNDQVDITINSSGGGGGSQNVFSTIAVSTGGSAVADSTTDTLTLTPAGNIAMTVSGDTTNDNITIATTLSDSGLVGKSTSGSGNTERITLGPALYFTGSQLNCVAETAAITCVFDGNGSTLQVGSKVYLSIPYGISVSSWTMLADAVVASGTCTIDIWKDSYANYPPTVADSIIGTGTKPNIAATFQKAQAAVNWTNSTTFNAGDTVVFNVDSATTVTKVTLVLRGTKLQ